MLIPLYTEGKWYMMLQTLRNVNLSITVAKRGVLA